MDSISLQECCLCDGQDESVAASTARAAKIARVPARSIDRHAGSSSSGDHSGRNHSLQLVTARGKSV